MSHHSCKRAKIIRVFALISPALFLTSCAQVSGLGFDNAVTSVNQISSPLWSWAWVAAGVVGVVTLILILWPAVFHRKKVGAPEFPKQTQYHIPVEVAYTLIPLAIIAVLFYFTAVSEAKIYKKPSATIMHEIQVKGIRWSWQFIYPEAGAKAIVTGTPLAPPTLVVPQGESVRYVLTSNDVVHGFWIPAFMIQMQNLPGVTNQLEFTANKLGTFPGRCNMLCGRDHSRMLFDVKVVTPANYKIYLESLKAANA